MAERSAREGNIHRDSSFQHLFGGYRTEGKMSTTDLNDQNLPSGTDAQPIVNIASTTMSLRRLISIALTIVVLGAIGIGVFGLISGSWMVNPVLSGSMRPGLAVGGVVVSERTPVYQLALRDVIVFRDPNNPSIEYVHRIVKITRLGSGGLLLNTQGDANSVQDPWTLTIKGSYVYRVRWSLPLIGYLAIAYANDRGLAMLGAGLVLIALAVTSITRRRRPSTDPNDGDADDDIQAELVN